ncbi:MAG: glycosyltransferase [Lachnospiraceae bacterium]|nr:glycosyltransferase [Lachnospiraceae bacterium]
MEKNKKISIVIPIYNTEQYIERCLRSIMCQTYTNLEIICVDDGSTDGSGVLLDKLSLEDERMQVIHKANEGVSAARNTALLAATGDYIGFVDSDDYVAPDYYEKLLSVFEENEKVDIATCSYCMDYEGDIVKTENQRKVPITPMSIEEFLPYMYERDTYKAVGGYLWTKLIKKTVIKNDDGSLKICFRREFGGADDIAFVAELMLNSSYIQYIDKALYYYFQREGSIVHSNVANLNNLHWVEVYEWILKQYQNQGINETSLDIIRRMYVYRCGKTLETAIEIQNTEKIHILREKIKAELPAYVKMNLDHLERVLWIVELLLYK